jgi:hypothetical protein
MIFYAPENGLELMRRYNEICKTMPDSVTTILAYLHAPPFPFVPPEVQFKPGYAVIAVCTDQAVGEKILAPLRKFGPPLFEMIAPLPYPAVQSLFDPALPPGTKGYLNGHYFSDLSEDLIQSVHSHTAQMPPGHSQMLILQLGGAVGRVPEGKTAFGGRQAQYLSMFVGIWEETGDRAPAVAWARGFTSDTEKLSMGGSYVNLADEMSETKLANSYGRETYEKLAKLKAKYDPQNVFRLNQNIRPKA